MTEAVDVHALHARVRPEEVVGRDEKCVALVRASMLRRAIADAMIRLDVEPSREAIDRACDQLAPSTLLLAVEGELRLADLATTITIERAIEQAIIADIAWPHPDPDRRTPTAE